MPINVQQVDHDLAKFAKAINRSIGLVTEKVAMDLHGKITKRTPVDTGRARASWDVTVGEPSEASPPEGDYPDAPQFPDLPIDGSQSVFIVSNLVYIEPLENGHSQQAPHGMVAISLAETEAEIDTILDGIAEQAENEAA